MTGVSHVKTQLDVLSGYFDMHRTMYTCDAFIIWGDGVLQVELMNERVIGQTPHIELDIEYPLSQSKVVNAALRSGGGLNHGFEPDRDGVIIGYRPCYIHAT